MVTHTFECRGLVKGRVTGEAVVSRLPVSFLGDIDIRSGEIVGDISDGGGSSARGKVVAGKILVMPGSRGSAGAWRFLYQLFRHHTHPIAIVSRDLPDPSVVQGAILADIPVLCGLDEAVVASIRDGDELSIDGDCLTIRAEAVIDTRTD